MQNALLSVEDLHVTFVKERETIYPVRGVNFAIRPREVLAIVGESGCGKSVTAQALMRLLPEGIDVKLAGNVQFQGLNLLSATQAQMQLLRGKEIGMIFQDPMTSLNPMLRIGDQIEEILALHLKPPRALRREMAIQLLRLVGIDDPKRRARQFPHEFSGGMRQRVVIAIGIACKPKLLIADEPTTALDVTVQAQILELFRDLLRDLEASLILITHDMGVVASIADFVVVMYGGQIMEQGRVDDIFYRPAHPYTQALLRSLPAHDARALDRLNPIEGQPPHLARPPRGCPFARRCDRAMRICTQMQPERFKTAEGHIAACHLHHPDYKYWSSTKKFAP